MTTEWIELSDLQAVALAQKEYWEIEYYRRMFDKEDGWWAWGGVIWSENIKYRGRPAQPKMKKVKMLCYTNEITIDWKNESLEVDEDLWIRVPSQDIEIEVPDNE